MLLELIILSGQSEKNKDLEILLLRRQLAMVERKLDKPLRVSRARLQQPEDGLDVEICEASSTTTIVKRRDPIFLPDGVFGGTGLFDPHRLYECGFLLVNTWPNSLAQTCAGY